MQYYQSAAMAEMCLLPFRPFVRLVREIASEAMTAEEEHRWERDALVSLQLFTEHILIMIFEMTYSFFAILLIPRNKIAIHAKRKTIMDHDMQLLQDLWKTIAPESAVGKESKDSKAQKEVWQGREKAHMHRKVTDMKERVRLYHANGIIPAQKLSAGEKGFCRKNDINFS